MFEGIPEIQQLIEFLTRVNPDPLFLLAAAGFLGVIMAFLIPMSIEIISKVAAKYNSDVIVRLLQDNFVSKYFPYFVLVNIGAMIAMRFFGEGELFRAPIYKGIMWVLLITALIITVLIGYIIYRIERIISDDNVPLNMLIKRVEEHIDSYNILPKRQNIIEFTEGIGDIILYQIRRKNNRSATVGLTQLMKMTVKLIRMKVSKPEKFEAFVYSPEMIKCRQENSHEEVHAFCFKNPDHHLGGLASHVNQIERTLITAISENNNEVAQFALRVLQTSLQHASVQPKNELTVEFLVRKIHNCISIAISQDNAISQSIVTWYIDNVLKAPHIGNGSFHIPYLDIYDPYFIDLMKQIINAGKFEKFRSVIDYMADNFSFSEYQKEKLWGYHYLLRDADFEKYLAINREQRVQRRVRNLIEEESQMYTIAQFSDWLESFTELKEIIGNNLTGEENKSKAQLLEGEVKDNAIKHLKYTRMLRLSYVIGSLCMLNENYEYIRYMQDVAKDLNKKDPGLNMIPQTLQAVMNDYLIFYDLYDRHKISASSYRRYILLLMEDLFDANAQQNFYLPFLRQDQIAPGMQALNELIEVGTDYSQREGSELSLILSFLNKEYKGIEKLIVKMQSNLTISKKVNDNFYASFIEGFNTRLVLRNIFIKYLKSYENKSKNKYKTLPNRAWGINELVEKANIISSSDQLKRTALQYGETMADIENMTLFNNLMKNCRRQRVVNLDRFLYKLGDPQDLLMISSYSAVNRLLDQQDRFHMNRYIDDARITTSNSDSDGLSTINGFVGYYDINKYPVPVFNFYYRGAGDYILVLFKSKIGKITHLPLVEHPANKNKYLKLTKDSMYFKLEELAKKPKAIKAYMDEAPPWITEVGDAKQQKDFLKQRLLITALENMSLTSATDEPIGYVVKIGAVKENRVQPAKQIIG